MFLADDDGVVVVVGGDEVDGAVGLRLVVFECGFVVVDEGNDDIAAAGGVALFADDVVAVGDVAVDHGVAPDLEYELVAGGGAGRGEDLFEVQVFAGFDGLDGRARGDGADQGQAGVARFVGQFEIRRQLQRARLVRIPDQAALFDERLDVLEDGDL